MRTYNFECIKCHCKFNVESRYLVQKENLACPNCSTELPNDVFEKLKSSATALKEYDENHPNVNEDETAKHFNLTIE